MSDWFGLSVSGGAWIALAFALVLLPLNWLVAVMVAACFHELCHILALRLLAGRVCCLRIGAGGAAIHAQPLSAGKELVCALAGPMGGLCLLLLARWFPRVAICAGIQSFYNLLPVYPLDGGRALSCAARMLLPPRKAQLFCQAVCNICLCGILMLGIYGTLILHLGLFPLLVAIALLIRAKPQILLAKFKRKGYNSANQHE